MKLLKIVLVTSILLGVLIAPISFISPVKAAADVDILSHTGYLDSLGSYHVVGEVENVGDQAVYYVRLTANFYDSSDAFITTVSAFAMLDVLLVDRKSPFNIVLLDLIQSAQVDHYNLTVDFSPHSPIPIGLQILSNSTYTDGLGMHIVGEIKNIATTKATSVKVIATYYNATGDVVGAELTNSIPSEIDPGKNATFNILLSSLRIPYVDTYDLTAEAPFQYAIVPEFATWTSIFLVLTLITVAIVIYKRRFLKTPIH